MNSEVILPFHIHQTHLNQILHKYLANHQLREDLIIESLNLKGEHKLFILDIMVKGQYNGTLEARFIPVFEDRQLILKDFD